MNSLQEEQYRASVIIPTYNGDAYIEGILTAVFRQETLFPFEVIVIDSGSSDNTLNIVRRFPVHLLVQIPNCAFNHGDTRNLGATLAKGEFFVYLTHDATPAHSKWLQKFIDAFSISENIANVVGKQIPRQGCNPTLKRDIEETFTMIGGGKDELTIYKIEEGKDGWEAYLQKKDIMRFNSDANAAYRKSAWEKVHFRRIVYAEDQLMGQDLLEAGFSRVYSPDAAVIHSNSFPIHHFLKRYFDEYRGLHIAFGYVDKVNLVNILPAAIYGWWKDSRYIWKQHSYSVLKKLYWTIIALFVSFSRRCGAYLGGRHEKLSPIFRRILSLEKQS